MTLAYNDISELIDIVELAMISRYGAHIGTRAVACLIERWGSDSPDEAEA